MTVEEEVEKEEEEEAVAFTAEVRQQGHVAAQGSFKAR